MDGHWFGVHSASSQGKGHPLMYGKPQPTIHYTDFPDGGGYPKGFMEWAAETMGCADMNLILHLCSGSVVTGTRVDIRPGVNPDIVADCRHVPLPDESFDFIMADPPYAESYAQNLYGTGESYPKPGEILKEAARLLRPGGKVGLLHFIVPMIRQPLKIRGTYGITSGVGNAIRCWTLCEKVTDGKWRNGR